MPALARFAGTSGAGGAGSAAMLGQAPSFAMAMTYLAMADSLGLAMGNAVASQQRGQVIADAATVQVLALIVKQGSQSP